MKKAIKNYLVKLQENDKKGFSLVELIIVMAIMAILVGIVAAQVLPYMEKSRQAKDQQVLSAICTDVNAAIANSGESCTGGSATLGNLESITNTKVPTELEDLRSGTALATIETNSKAALKSKLMKGGDIQVDVDNSTGKVTVWVDAQDGKGKVGLSSLKGSGAKNVVESEG